MSGCSFAFDKGFCYGRIFITAGGFLLLITISQRQGPFVIPYQRCLTTLFIKPYSDADSLLSQFVQVLMISSLKVFPRDSPLSLLLQVKPNISSCRKHEYGEKIAPILFMWRGQKIVWLSYTRLSLHPFKYKIICFIFKCSEANLPSFSHMEFIMSF